MTFPVSVSGEVVVTNAVTVRVVKVHRLAGTVTLGITIGDFPEVLREYSPGDTQSSTLKVKL